MKTSIRPAALSIGLAVLALALLFTNWNPVRAVIYALGWIVVTALLVDAERRRTR
ncbi:hypothetical protein ACQPW1_39115 [Nocardia sp. CA-128927]|uniref:hypothetical protein n=1 Tax=Nocardia sp. CA-128927 TaxID=3239975 RepID=UPI003D98A996